MSSKKKIKKSPLEKYFGKDLNLKSVPEKIIFSEEHAIATEKIIEENYNRRKVSQKIIKLKYNI